MSETLIPRRAPFSKGQREWLSGLFNDTLMNTSREQGAPESGDELALVDLDEAPWHDMDMPLSERMALAEDEPFMHRLMAAMAQQDCGQCGYDCKGYAQVLAEGQETDLSLCVPGGTTTRKQVKALFAEHGPVAAANQAAATGPVGYDRRNPWSAPVTTVMQLHGEGAPKDTRHIVINLQGSGIDYKPGDSLGVYAQNDPELVSGVLSLLDQDPETAVTVNGISLSLKEALTDWRDITVPSDESLALLAEYADNGEQKSLLRGLAAEGLDESGKDLLDILRDFPSARAPLQELVDNLGALKPRLYSIASSQKAHSDEVHLTVSVVQYESLGRHRKGVASNFLADRAEDRWIPIYLQAAKDFGVPEDDTTPMIMVGPGTGIAPFRAFLEERQARGATGGAWLFFGNPHSSCDFLYREELEAFQATGTLSRLDTAFSRDQSEKVYVQDRIREQGAELWRWLESGACFYVCGDAEHMAPAVHEALRDVIREHGGHSDDQADHYLKELAQQERYQRDVY